MIECKLAILIVLIDIFVCKESFMIVEIIHQMILEK